MTDQVIPVIGIRSLSENKHHVGAAVVSLEQLFHHADDARRYSFYCFLLVTGGNGRHAIDLSEFSLAEGSLVFMMPNQIHQVTRSVNLTGHALLFNDQILAKWNGPLPAWTLLRTYPRFNLRVTTHALADFIQHYRSIAAALSVNDPYTIDAVVHSIALFLIHAARLSRERSTLRPKFPQDFLYNFQQLIEQHFRELKSPSLYAEKLHITANYLNSLCKKRAGKSAGELIRQRILLEAKRLLAHTELSVSEVAVQLQFEDNSYFGRFFRKYTGMSPGTFRKKYRD